MTLTHLLFFSRIPMQTLFTTPLLLFLILLVLSSFNAYAVPTQPSVSIPDCINEVILSYCTFIVERQTDVYH